MTTALLIHLRATIATAQLDWANWQTRFAISWSLVKPGRLVFLNPKLLR
jgi:hypothetical protein